MLIRIDVEGSGAQILAGADPNAKHKPRIMICLNPWSAAAAGTSTASIVDFLSSHGYRTFSLAESFPQVTAKEDIPLDRQVNLVATQ